MAEADTKPPDLRERVRIIIHEADTPAGKFFDVVLILAILASVGVVMFITVPGIDKDWPHCHECIRVNYSQDRESVRQGIKIIGEEIKRAYDAA